MRRLILLSAMTVALCGCLHPIRYERGEMPVPPVWPEKTVALAGGADAVRTPWREFFADEHLRSLIELALANNRDLRVATLNVERVQALYRIQRAEQIPTVSGAASGEAYRLPEKMSTSGKSETIGQYTASVGVTAWELDLFGRIRSLKSAALERYLASEQVHAAAQISLVATVAQSYLSLAADCERLQLAQATLNAQQATYDLILRTRNAGMASELDVRQAQSQVEAARADVVRYTAQVELDKHALGLLVGAAVPPELLPVELAPDSAFKEIAEGLPSEVLLRRPDILAAEHQLKAANANIGAARAAFFPRISLTAAAGFLSSDLADLFRYGSRTWHFSPQIGLPIFDAGARRASLRVAEVDRQMALAEYEKAIQSAFREVSDALSLRSRLVEQQQAQEALVRSLEEAHRLAEARYRAGVDSYLSVLVAERSLYSARQALVSIRLARLSNLVSLYKVLGGGA